MATRDTIEELVAKVLDGTEHNLRVDKLRLDEDLKSGRVDVRCEAHHKSTGEPNVIEGTGVGAIDALFHGLVEVYSQDYPSLTTIRFADFSVKAKLDTGRGALSDSAAQVQLIVANSDDHEFAFEDTSPSMTRSSVQVVVDAVSFFINCERAFIAVHKALQHAKEAKRPDSIQAYTAQLSTLVQATSYSEVIEQLKKDIETET